MRAMPPPFKAIIRDHPILVARMCNHKLDHFAFFRKCRAYLLCSYNRIKLGANGSATDGPSRSRGHNAYLDVVNVALYRVIWANNLYQLRASIFADGFGGFWGISAVARWGPVRKKVRAHRCPNRKILRMLCDRARKDAV